MDREQWAIVLGAVKRASRRLGRTPRTRFSDWLIVAMYLWAVAHDRSQSWACGRAHYSGVFRPRRLPSVSQFNRRLRTERVRWILQRVHEELAGSPAATALSDLDGKPLTVGPASKDPDAKRGRIMGGFAKGYKLHAWDSEDRRIVRWAVMLLNVHETPVARVLLRDAPPLSERSLVLADGNDDAWELHRDVARCGGALLVPPRGFAEHPVSLRQMGSARRESLAVWQQTPALAAHLYKQRIHVEGAFSNLTSYGGGLGPLPGFVRRLGRVRRWVGAKIILYHARLRVRQARQTAA